MQDAQDVTQEVFVKAQRNWGSLQNPERPLPWLTQIAVHTATDFVRKRMRERRAVTEVRPPDARPDRSAEIHRALADLDEEDHVLICLRYQRNLSYEEIARELGITRDAVRGKLYRVHQILRARRDHDVQP
jgi:RNA polymerase sigma-70 factor (ECF subfamily)